MGLLQLTVALLLLAHAGQASEPCPFWKLPHEMQELMIAGGGPPLFRSADFDERLARHSPYVTRHADQVARLRAGKPVDRAFVMIHQLPAYMEETSRLLDRPEFASVPRLGYSSGLYPIENLELLGRMSATDFFDGRRFPATPPLARKIDVAGGYCDLCLRNAVNHMATEGLKVLDRMEMQVHEATAYQNDRRNLNTHALSEARAKPDYASRTKELAESMALKTGLTLSRVDVGNAEYTFTDPAGGPKTLTIRFVPRSPSP